MVDLSGAVAAAAVPSPEPTVVAGTWHPHVYGNPPRTPTGHNIADILGWTKSSGADEQPLNLSTARRTNGTVLDLTKIKRKGNGGHLRVGPLSPVASPITPRFTCTFRAFIHLRRISRSKFYVFWEGGGRLDVSMCMCISVCVCMCVCYGRKFDRRYIDEVRFDRYVGSVFDWPDLRFDGWFS